MYVSSYLHRYLLHTRHLVPVVSLDSDPSSRYHFGFALMNVACRSEGERMMKKVVSMLLSSGGRRVAYADLRLSMVVEGKEHLTGEVSGGVILKSVCEREETRM